MASRTNPNIISSSYDSSPTLPLDLFSEILSRLPVKFLLQFRCVCKFWNFLISDQQFARKHLNHSTTHNLHGLSYNYHSSRYIIESYPLQSVFTDITTDLTLFDFPSYDIHKTSLHVIGSCHGILCLADYYSNFLLLWNPSIRKLKELPLLESAVDTCFTMFGFGYDSLTDAYKVIVINKTEGKLHTLGTNFWKSILDFPSGCFSVERKGKFVSGTINWLTTCFIASFDLRKESYQKIFLPNCDRVVNAAHLVLGVLRDSLCIFADSDVWIMKEYGNQQSWTKLFTISKRLIGYYTLIDLICSFEDDQVLIKAKGKLQYKFIVYNFRKGTFQFINFSYTPEVCVESLISPCCS